MKFGTLFANFASLALVSQAAVASQKCGSTDPVPEALEAAAKLRDAQRTEGAGPRRDVNEEGLLITTYVHVVEDQQHAGFVTDKMIADQIRIPTPPHKHKHSSAHTGTPSRIHQS
jgi:hypothetical protein